MWRGGTSLLLCSTSSRIGGRYEMRISTCSFLCVCQIGFQDSGPLPLDSQPTFCISPHTTCTPDWNFCMMSIGISLHNRSFCCQQLVILLRCYLAYMLCHSIHTTCPLDFLCNQHISDNRQKRHHLMVICTNQCTNVH